MRIMPLEIRENVSLRQANHRHHCFTLIELMIVVVILAALATMVAPRLLGRSDDAKRDIAASEIEGALELALELYKLDNGLFPTTAQGLDALLRKPTPDPGNWRGPYLDKTPADPWKRPYRYKCPGTHNPESYDLASDGKDGTEGTEDDVFNWH